MKILPVFVVLFSFSLLISNSCSEDPKEINNGPDTIPKTLETFYFEHDDLNRSYSIYLPDDLPSNAPLVFVLHGRYEVKNDMYHFRFNQIADTAGFAVCYPQSAKDDNGITEWNAGVELLVDDIGFLSELAEFLQQEHNLDPDRTFCCGFSNGGYMSYSLACEASDVFTAIASVAGLMTEYTRSHCTPPDPIPVLHIHGLSDNFVKIDGNNRIYGPPLENIIAYWASLNNCTTTDTVTISTTTTAYFHRNGTDGNEVLCYLIRNHEHEWPAYNSNIGINATEVIWEFFSKY